MLLTTLLIATFVNQLVPADMGRATPGAFTIPLVCDAQKALIVPVSVQGAPPRPYLLDTGASITTIDDRTAAALALVQAGRIPSRRGTDALVTAQLMVGPVVLPAGPVATEDFRRLRGLLGNVTGILGSDALRAMGHATIDYDRCVLTIGAISNENTGASADQTAGGVRVPLEWHQGRPVIVLPAGGRLLLDSGATTVSVFNGSRVATNLRWISTPTALVRLDRVDGVRVGFLGRLASLAIGAMYLRDLPAVAVGSWYEPSDRSAPDGLLPLALFSRVHLVYAEGYAVLFPPSH
jgi:hypothetical protein